jgi:predicted RNA binding protein YcfA (HicA-like mRNA interferase family)
MRLPRDISGDELIQILQRVGYETVRQTGSHVRLSCAIGEDTHNITIPRHKNLKIGTLNGILQDVANRLGIEKEEILKKR